MGFFSPTYKPTVIVYNHLVTIFELEPPWPATTGEDPSSSWAKPFCPSVGPRNNPKSAKDAVTSPTKTEVLKAQFNGNKSTYIHTYIYIYVYIYTYHEYVLTIYYSSVYIYIYIYELFIWCMNMGCWNSLVCAQKLKQTLKTPIFQPRRRVWV